MRYIIDEDGAILSELGDGDRIVRRSSLDAKEKIDEQEAIYYDSFCILNIKEYKAVMKELSNSARLIFSQLVPYTQYTTCLLAHSNGKPLSTRKIIEITGLSKNTAAKALSELVGKDLLFRGRNSREVQWYMNPYIVHRGNVQSKVLKTMFRNYRRRTE